MSFSHCGSVCFGHVRFHAKAGGVCMRCVSEWSVIPRTSILAKCRVAVECRMILPSDMLEPCVAMKSQPGEICQVPLPPRFRAASSRRRLGGAGGGGRGREEGG
eukprot:8707919-Pyramimonas_sp.AAC.1